MGNGCSKCCNCHEHKKHHGTLSSASSVYRRRSRGGIPIENSDRFRITQTSNAVQLAVEHVQREDAGHYTLFARTKDNNVIRKDMELIVEDRSAGEDPPNFIRRLGDLSVKVGTRTRLLVEIRSSTDVKITWYRNDRRICENDRIKQINEGSFYCLEISPLILDDGGQWMVMVENLGGRNSCIAHLNVLVPKAYKPPEFIEELRAVLTEQGTVSLECKVVGVPTPMLRWFKDSKEIKAGDVFALTANVDDPTSLGTYTCEAVNCMGKSYSSSKVHVVGRGSREGSLKPADSLSNNALPPIFTNELRGVSVRISETVILGCQVVVPPWPKSVAWYNKEGRVESSEKYKLIEDGLGVYMIEIKPSESCDEGEWKCVVTSQDGCVGISTCTVNMDIPKNYRKPRFMESLKAVLTEEGLVSFECKVVGFPTPLLKWYKDGQELKPGDVYQLTGTNSLGTYCCIAKNCMGDCSSVAVLTVEDIQNQLNDEELLLFANQNQPPKFVEGLKSQDAKINEAFKFSVTVKATPDPVLTWFRDELPIEPNERYNHYNGENEHWHLDIRCVEFVDQAEWKCVAVNDFGTSITSCFLKLQIPRHYKKPRFLECLRAVLTEEGAVNLECKVIGVPQPVLKWYKDGVELKPGDIHRIISGQDGTCCLGTYTCEARNCMGVVASSASLLGYEDAYKNTKSEEVHENELQRNFSLSTIQEERTSQMYETPVGDITIDEKGDVSFSFDGKEVSVSLYETPDLTEEEALKIVEMYADQISEHVTEHNIVELPPLRFVKETSQSGKLLMEAVVIDIAPEYFSHEEDMRTEAGMDDISISEITIHGSSGRGGDFDKETEVFAQKSLEKMEEELSMSAPIRKRKKSRPTETDEFFSLSKASSSQGDEDTSELQTFASAQMSSKMETSAGVQREAAKEELQPPKRKKGKKLSDSDSSKTNEDEANQQDISGAVGDGLMTSKPAKIISNEADIEKNLKTLVPLAKYLKTIENHLTVVENEVMAQSANMMTPASAEQSIAIIRNINDPIKQIQSKLRVYSGETPLDALFRTMEDDIRLLHTGLQVIEKCVEIDETGATLIQRTSVCIIDSVGEHVIKALHEVKQIASLFEGESLRSHINLTVLDIHQGIEITQGTIKSQALLQEAQDLETAKHFNESVAKLQAMPETLSFDKMNEAKLPIEADCLKIICRPVLEIQEALEKIEHELSKEENDDQIYAKVHKKVLDNLVEPVKKLQDELENIERIAVSQAGSESIEQKINIAILDIVTPPLFELKKGLEIISKESSDNIQSGMLTVNAVESMVPPLQEIQNGLAQLAQDIESGQVTEDFGVDSADTQKLLQSIAQAVLHFESNIDRLSSNSSSNVQSGLYSLKEELSALIGNILDTGFNKYHITLFENLKRPIDELNYCILQTERKSISGSLADLIDPLRSLNDKVKLGLDILNISNISENERNTQILAQIRNIIKNVEIDIEEHEFKIIQKEVEMDERKAHEEDNSFISMKEAMSMRIAEDEAIEQLEELKNCLSTTKAHNFQDTKLGLIVNELSQSVTALAAQAQKLKESTYVGDENKPLRKPDDSLRIILEIAKPIQVLTTAINNATQTAGVEKLTQDNDYRHAVQEFKKCVYNIQVGTINTEDPNRVPIDWNSLQIADNLLKVQKCLDATLQTSVSSEQADDVSTMDDISGLKTAADSLTVDGFDDQSIALEDDDVYPPKDLEKAEKNVDTKLAELKNSIASVLFHCAELDVGSLKNETVQKVKAAVSKMQDLEQVIAERQLQSVVEPLGSLSERSDQRTFADAVCSLEACVVQVQECLLQSDLQDISENDVSELKTLASPLRELKESLNIFHNQELEQVLSLCTPNMSLATAEVIQGITPFVMSIQENHALETLESLAADTSLTQLKQLVQPIQNLQTAVLNVQQQFHLTHATELPSSMNLFQLTAIAKPILGLREAILHVQEDLALHSIQNSKAFEVLKLKTEPIYNLLRHCEQANFEVLEHLEDISTEGEISALKTFAETGSITNGLQSPLEAKMLQIETHHIEKSLAGGIQQLQICLKQTKAFDANEVSEVRQVMTQLKTELEHLRNELAKQETEQDTILSTSNIAKTMFKLKECLVHTYEAGFEESLEDVEKMFEDLLQALPGLEIQLAQEMFVKIDTDINKLTEMCGSDQNKLKLNELVNPLLQLDQSIGEISKFPSADIEKSSAEVINLQTQLMTAFRSVNGISEHVPNELLTSLLTIQATLVSIVDFIEHNEGSLRIIELLQEVDALSSQFEVLSSDIAARTAQRSEAELNNLIQNVKLAKSFLTNIEQGLNDNNNLVNAFIQQNQNEVEKLQRTLIQIENEIMAKPQLTTLSDGNISLMRSIEDQFILLQENFVDLQEKLEEAMRTSEVSVADQKLQSEYVAEETKPVLEAYLNESLANMYTLTSDIECIKPTKISIATSEMLTSLKTILLEMGSAIESSKGNNIEDVLFLPLFKLRDLLAFTRKAIPIESSEEAAAKLVTNRANSIFHNILNGNASLHNTFIHDITAKTATNIAAVVDLIEKHKQELKGLKPLHSSLKKLSKEISSIRQEHNQDLNSQKATIQNIHSVVAELRKCVNDSSLDIPNESRSLIVNSLNGILEKQIRYSTELLQELEAENECFVKIAEIIRNCLLLKPDRNKVDEQTRPMPETKQDNQKEIKDMLEKIVEASENDALRNAIAEYTNSEGDKNATVKLIFKLREHIVHTYDGKPLSSFDEQVENIIKLISQNKPDIMEEEQAKVPQEIEEETKKLTPQKELETPHISTSEVLLEKAKQLQLHGLDTTAENDLLSTVIDFLAASETKDVENKLIFKLREHIVHTYDGKALSESENQMESLVSIILENNPEIVNTLNAEFVSLIRKNISQINTILNKFDAKSKPFSLIENLNQLQDITQALEKVHTIEKSSKIMVSLQSVAMKVFVLFDDLQELKIPHLSGPIDDIKRQTEHLYDTIEKSEKPIFIANICQSLSKLTNTVLTACSQLSAQNEAAYNKTDELKLKNSSLNTRSEGVQLDTEPIRHEDTDQELISKTSSKQEEILTQETLTAKKSEKELIKAESVDEKTKTKKEQELPQAKTAQVSEVQAEKIEEVEMKEASSKQQEELLIQQAQTAKKSDKELVKEESLDEKTKTKTEEELPKTKTAEVSEIKTEKIEEVEIKKASLKQQEKLLIQETHTAKKSEIELVKEESVDEKSKKTTKEEELPKAKAAEVSEVKAEKIEEVDVKEASSKQQEEQLIQETLTAKKSEKELVKEESVDEKAKKKTKEEELPKAKTAEVSEVKAEKIEEVEMKEASSKQQEEQLLQETLTAKKSEKELLKEESVEEKSKKTTKEEELSKAKTAEVSEVKAEKIEEAEMKEATSKQKEEQLIQETLAAQKYEKELVKEENVEEKSKKTTKAEELPKAKTAEVSEVKAEKIEEVEMKEESSKQQEEQLLQETLTAKKSEKELVKEESVEEKSKKTTKHEELPKAKAAEVSEVKAEKIEELDVKEASSKQQEEQLLQETLTAKKSEKELVKEESVEEKSKKTTKEEELPKVKTAEVSEYKAKTNEEVEMKEASCKQQEEQLLQETLTAKKSEKELVKEESVEEKSKKTTKEEELPKVKTAEVSEVNAEKIEELDVKEASSKQQEEQLLQETLTAQRSEKELVKEGSIDEKSKKATKEEEHPKTKTAEVSEVKAEKIDEVEMKEASSKRKEEQLLQETLTAKKSEKELVKEECVDKKSKKTTTEEELPKAKTAEVSEVKAEKIEEVEMKEAPTKQPEEQLSQQTQTAKKSEKEMVKEESVDEKAKKTTKELPKPKTAKVSEIKAENIEEVETKAASTKQTEEVPIQETLTAKKSEKELVKESSLGEKAMTKTEKELPKAKMGEVSEIKAEKIEKVEIKQASSKQQEELLIQKTQTAKKSEKELVKEKSLDEKAKTTTKEEIPKEKTAEVSDVKAEKIEEVEMKDTSTKQKEEQPIQETLTAKISEKELVKEKSLDEKAKTTTKEEIHKAKTAEVSDVKAEKIEEEEMKEASFKQQEEQLIQETLTAKISEKELSKPESVDEKTKIKKEEKLPKAKSAEVPEVKAEKIEEVELKETSSKQQEDLLIHQTQTAKKSEKELAKEESLDEKKKIKKEEALSKPKTAEVSEIKAEKVKEVEMKEATSKQQEELLGQETFAAKKSEKMLLKEESVDETAKTKKEKELHKAKTAEVSEIKAEKIEELEMKEASSKQQEEQLVQETLTAKKSEKELIKAESVDEKTKTKKEEELPKAKTAEVSGVKAEKIEEVEMKAASSKQQEEQRLQETLTARKAEEELVKEKSVDEKSKKTIKEEELPKAKTAEVSEVKADTIEEVEMKKASSKQQEEQLIQETFTAKKFEKELIKAESIDEKAKTKKEEGLTEGKTVQVSEVQAEKIEEVKMKEASPKQQEELPTQQTQTAKNSEKELVKEQSVDEKAKKAIKELPKAKTAEVSEIKAEKIEEVQTKGASTKQTEELPIQETLTAKKSEKELVKESSLGEKAMTKTEKELPKAKMGEVSEIKAEKIEKVEIKQASSKQQEELLIQQTQTAKKSEKELVKEKSLDEKAKTTTKEEIPKEKTAEVSDVKAEKIEEVEMKDTSTKQKEEQPIQETLTAKISEKELVKKESVDEKSKNTTKEEKLPKTKTAESSKVKAEKVEEINMTDTSSKQQEELLVQETLAAKKSKKELFKEESVEENTKTKKAEDLSKAKTAEVSEVKAEKIEEVKTKDTSSQQQEELLIQETLTAKQSKKELVNEESVDEKAHVRKEEQLPKVKAADVSEVKEEKIEEVETKDAPSKRQEELLIQETLTAKKSEKELIKKERDEKTKKKMEEKLQKSKSAEVLEDKAEKIEKVEMKEASSKQQEEQLLQETLTTKKSEKELVKEERVDEKSKKTTKGGELPKTAEVSEVIAEKIEEVVMKEASSKQQEEELLQETLTAKKSEKELVKEESVDEKSKKTTKEELPKEKPADLSEVKAEEIDDVEKKDMSSKRNEKDLEQKALPTKKSQKDSVKKASPKKKEKKGTEEKLATAEKPDISEAKDKMLQDADKKDKLSKKQGELLVPETPEDIAKEESLDEKTKKMTEKQIAKTKTVDNSEIKAERVEKVEMKDTSGKQQEEVVVQEILSSKKAEKKLVEGESLDEKTKKIKKDQIPKAGAADVSEIIAAKIEMKDSLSKQHEEGKFKEVITETKDTELVKLKEGKEEVKVIQATSPETMDSEYKSKKELRNMKRKPNFELKLTNRNSAVGSDIKLTCSVSGNDVCIQWFKDKTLISNNAKYRSSCCDGLACLEISTVDIKDSGIFTCIASNLNGEVETSCLVTVYEVPTSKFGTPPIFTRNIRGKFFKRLPGK